MWVLLRNYGGLSLYFVGLGGWVVALPAYGPVGDAWASAHTTTVAANPLWFVAFLAVSLIGGGILWDRHPQLTLRGIRGAVIANILLTLAVASLQPATWPVWFAAMGVSSGLGVTAWARIFSQSVNVAYVGRAVGLIAAGIATVLWLSTLVVRETPPGFALGLMLILLATAWRTVPFVRRAADSPTPAATSVTQNRLKQMDLGRITVMLVCFALVGGIARFVIGVPAVSEAGATLFGAAFVFGALASGILADRGQLRTAIVIGTGLLALSAFIEALGQRPSFDLIGDTLTCIAIGFVEPITWFVFISRATRKSSGRWFGWVLNIYVLRILVGVLVTKFLYFMPEQQLHLFGAVSTIFSALCFFGATDVDTFVGHLVVSRDEPAVPSESVTVTDETPAGAADLLEYYFGHKLSARELEVGRLAVEGVPSREIAGRTFLSENTVKTHLKSLYRKTEAANRNDLYRKLTRKTASGTD